MEEEIKEYLNNKLLEISASYEYKVSLLTHRFNEHTKDIYYEKYQALVKEAQELRDLNKKDSIYIAELREDIEFLKKFAQKLRDSLAYIIP